MPLTINQLEQHLEKLKEKGELTLKMITNLQLKRQKSSLRGALPDLKLVKSPTPVPYGRVTDVGGKCPKHLFKGIGEASDSDTSQKSKRDDRKGHSDSLTDS